MADLTIKHVNSILQDLNFDDNGLIPAIAQQFDSGEVVMMGWMNREAVTTTLLEKRAVYWSRSRKEQWRKGSTSGNVQDIIEFRWDCDNDTILLQVDQSGNACHTGRLSCFYKKINFNN